MTLTIEQIVSADGYAAAPDGDLSFFAAADFDDNPNDTEQLQWLAGVDAILFGATTYQMFSQYWPDVDPAVEAAAGPINALPKFVVSNSLQVAPWGEAEIEILRGDPVQAVRDLKQRFGSIVVWGSLKLTDALFQADEVDQLRLRIVPVLIGDGLRFTPAGLGQQQLTLKSSTPQPSGHINHSYSINR